jgi:vacuolar-type H+-ATPase subunit H
MKRIAGTLILTLTLCVAVSNTPAQSLITTVTVGPNQIGQVKTTQGITTRIIFPEIVRDIICGDLYDPASGKGSFVIQRIDNDVFLKPVVSKGLSNLFVKTGEKGEHTYSFDLQIVGLDQAHRVVNVSDSSAGHVQPSSAGSDASEDAKKLLSAAEQRANETLSNARQQADRLMAQTNQQASEVYAKALQRSEEVDRQSANRARQEIEDRFSRAMIQGVREVKSVDSHVVARRVSLALDPRMLTFDDRSYLRYTIRNSGDKDFAFNGLALERRSGKDVFVIQAKVIQGRAENKIGPGEAIMGIIVFDAKEVGGEDKLTLYVRGEDNTELARLTIQ